MVRQMEYGTDRESEKIKKSDLFLMLLLLLLSGNPFFDQKFSVFISLASVISAGYLLRNCNRSVRFRTLFIFTFFIGYEVVHALLFQLDYSQTLLKLFMVLLFSFVVVNILKDRFVEVFIQTMYLITLVSFLFTALCYVPGAGRALYDLATVLFPLDKDFRSYSQPTLIVYTFLPEYFNHTLSYTRNAGIFWEGGAFAVYLNLVLYLKYYTRKVSGYKDLFDKQALVFIVGIFTTVSTMGFLALVCILTFYSIHFRSNIKYLFLILLLIVSTSAFYNFDFLGDKLSKQLAVSEKENNRFGAALMDLEDIAKRPVLGWSRRIEVLFKTNVYDERSHRPNGLTNLLRSYGLLYFLVYFYLVYSSFKSIGRFYGNPKRSLALLGILLLWIVSFSELIFDHAFFKSLVFLYLVYEPIMAQFKATVHGGPIALSS